FAAKSELLPSKGGTQVPIFEVFPGIDAGIIRLVLDVGVATSQRDAEIPPLAFVTQRAFPGIAVVVVKVGAGDTKSFRRFGADGRAAERQAAAGVRGVGPPRLEAVPYRRQVGDLVVVACRIVGVVQLARVDEAARAAADTTCY